MLDAVCRHLVQDETERYRAIDGDKEFVGLNLDGHPVYLLCDRGA
jgi:hypothetical protein